MNIKRLLSFILIISMLMTSMLVIHAEETETYVGQAENIITDVESYNRATEVLSMLGIMKGRANGDFGMTDALTRAEMCAIAIRFIGLDSEKNAVFSDSFFSDVASEHWAKYYIDMATSHGFVQGNGDNTFAPDSSVTIEQAAKIIVCALGYEPKAQSIGEYPESYLSVAMELGLFKGIKLAGQTDMPIARGQVAMLVYNALEADMMEVVKFGDAQNSSVVEDMSVLKVYHKIERKRGTVTATCDGSLSNQLAEKGEIQIDGIDYKTALNTEAYLGYSIEFYRTITESTEKSEVLAIFMIDDQSEKVVIDFEDIAVVNVDSGMNIKIEYFDQDGTRKKNFTVKNPIIIYNGKAENFVNAAATQTFLDEHVRQGNFVIRRNAMNSRQDLLFINNYTSYTVADISTEHGQVMYHIYSADKIQRGMLELSTNGDKQRSVFYYDAKGNMISPGELMIGDVISVFESKDCELYKIYRSKKQVTGNVEARVLLADRETTTDVVPEEPATFTTMTELNMSGFTVTQGGGGNSSWGFKAEKDYNGRKVQISTDGGGGTWMINKWTSFVNWSEIGGNVQGVPEFLQGDTLFCLRRESTNHGSTWGTPTPNSAVIANGVVNNNRIKQGETVRVTAWVYPKYITTVGGDLTTDGIDQSSDINYRMWLMEPWVSNENPGYNSGNPGTESSVGTIPANQWSEISFEYTVNSANKNITSVRIDNHAQNGELYPLRLYLAGVKVEKADASDTFKGDVYIAPTDTQRYEIYIDGVGYKPADNFYAAMVPDNEEVTLLLDYNDKIAGFISENKKFGYGLVLDVGVIDKAFGEKILKVKILETDGTTKVYETTEKVRAYNGTEVVKMPAENLVTDQPSNPLTDWHLWSTNNADNFLNLSRLWLDTQDKSKAASRKIVYFGVNSEGKINTIMVPSIPENNPECKIKMVSNYDVDTWRNRSNLSVAVGSRQLIYTNVLDMFNNKREQTTYRVSNNAVLYEAFSMNYDEADYSVLEYGATTLSAGNVYDGMTWNEAALYKYPGSNTIDFMIITPRRPSGYTTVVVKGIGKMEDRSVLYGWSGGQPYRAEIRPNTRLMEYIPIASLKDDDSAPTTSAEAVFVTKDMLPELAEEGKRLYGITLDHPTMGAGSTPYVEDGNLQSGDIVRVVERDGEIVYLEVARRASTGVTVTHSSTRPNTGMYWQMFTAETSIRGEVVGVNTRLGIVEVKGYYSDIAEVNHSHKNMTTGGEVVVEFTTWLNMMQGINAMIYDYETGTCRQGSINDVEIGDEIYSYSLASAPSGIVVMKNYSNR